MTKVAVIANVHLLEESQRLISELSEGLVTFPSDEVQPDEDTMIERTGDADAILVSPGTRVSRSYLEACQSVKYVGICGTSKENVDISAIVDKGIQLTNVIDYGDEPAAEFIFMQLEQLARGIGQYQWQDYPVELMGKTIGIVGLGALGTAVANLALAYKMKVVYYSRTRKEQLENKGIEYLEKPELFEVAQIIVVCTPSNYVAIEERDFEQIGSGKIIVQASMGRCLQPDAFLNWIASDNNLAVFDYSAGHDSYLAYKDLPRVTFPKIVAGHTFETKQRLGAKVFEQLREYANQG